MSRRRVHSLMSGQDGIVTRRQALDCGLGVAAIDHYVHSGEWRSLAPGVYLRADRERTPAVRLRGRLRSRGRGDGVGPSAAWWHGLLDRAPKELFVTVPHRRVVKAADGVRMRRRDLPPEDVTSVRGLCVTGLPLSVLEAAVELENGSVFLDRALQRHTIEVDGWAWHRDPARHRHDLERQNVLVNAGRHVLRFTWHALANDPEGVVRQIRQALA